ncbi:PH domain-containing protein [Tieghemostelium lacteum]|uniref:PH domain-containing protein n=1 Tax=Tieghemostelium lacteum TaxID=361077 RepID=A0A152A5U1_TIELA|nr:PH domain-containing protein [Tieghemostelium lacteum]|eukprot:KYR01590.1 PH domain-containing protein [Tieghemostelium lacteum]
MDHNSYPSNQDDEIQIEDLDDIEQIKGQYKSILYRNSLLEQNNETINKNNSLLLKMVNDLETKAKNSQQMVLAQPNYVHSNTERTSDIIKLININKELVSQNTEFLDRIKELQSRLEELSSPLTMTTPSQSLTMVHNVRLKSAIQEKDSLVKQLESERIQSNHLSNQLSTLTRDGYVESLELSSQAAQNEITTLKDKLEIMNENQLELQLKYDKLEKDLQSANNQRLTDKLIYEHNSLEYEKTISKLKDDISDLKISNLTNQQSQLHLHQQSPSKSKPRISLSDSNNSPLNYTTPPQFSSSRVMNTTNTDYTNDSFYSSNIHPYNSNNNNSSSRYSKG